MRVAVLGMGVIGKRLADAVDAHPDLELAGVGVRRINGAVLARPGFRYFVTGHAADESFQSADVVPAGTWPELLKETDLVVDAGPSRSGAGRAQEYRDAGVAVRFSGGERDPTLGPVLHPALNRAAGVGLTSARLASCNTTAIGRVIGAIGAREAARWRATIIRCCTDTDKAGKGITNGAVFDARPSHHSHDIREMVPGIDLTTLAVTVPMVAGHVILMQVEFDGADPAAAADRLRSACDVTVLDGERAHNSAIIRADALARLPQRADRYDVAVQIDVLPNGLSLGLSLDNEAIVIPEAIDGILAYRADRG